MVKVQTVGDGTLTASIPKKIVKQLSVNEGDVLLVFLNGDSWSYRKRRGDEQ